MRELIFAIKGVPTQVHAWTHRAELRKIQSAVTHLRRLQKTERDLKEKGVILAQGDLFLAPHPAAKPADAFSVPWEEYAGQAQFFFQLGRLQTLLETMPKNNATRPLHAEVERVKNLLHLH